MVEAAQDKNILTDEVHKGGSRLRKFKDTCDIPGHALHEKALQRQKSVVPLVGSQEQRALLVPLRNR